MPRLSVQLVAWNGVKYIPHLFRSLREQTFRDWDLLVIDNGSTDGTVEAIERETQSFPVPARIIRNPANRGFAGGHNQGFAISNIKYQISNVDAQAPAYVQLLNQDTVLAPEYFERLVEFMERTPQCGATQGVLLRWDFSRAGEPDGGRTEIVDTLGLRVLRSRRVVELGTGEQLKSQISNFKLPIEVFGVSGALPMYRATALRDVALLKPEASNPKSQGTGNDSGLTAYDLRLTASEVFDEDFFSYKEDVDLAFRLRSAGWTAFVVPTARAWHDRTAAGPRELSDAAAMDLRRSKSPLVRYHSYKNHLLTLVKNEHHANFVRHWPWVVGYELKKFAYVLLRERDTLRALGELWRQLPAMRAKRRAIMAKWKVPPRELRQWFH